MHSEMFYVWTQKNNKIKWKYVLCLEKCIKVCGQTLRFYSFASKSAVSFVPIFENRSKYEKLICKSWQKPRNCETIGVLNWGFARLKWLRKVSIRLWKSDVVIGSLKWFFWCRAIAKYKRKLCSTKWHFWKNIKVYWRELHSFTRVIHVQ